MSWKVLIIFFLLIFTQKGISQHYFFKQYSTNEGLDGLNIEALHQSQDGYLWIASHLGLAKFDGKTFVNYGISEGVPDSRILSITEDFYGNMWFGTTNSLVKFDGENFVAFYPYKDDRLNFTRSICTDKDGNLWLAASGGICSLPLSKSDTITTFNYFSVSEDARKNMAHGITIDNNNVIWATTGNGLYKIKNDSIQMETKNSGDYIVVDNQNNKWMTAWSNGKEGLRMWDGDSLHFFGDLIQSPPTSLQVDDNGNIWVATFGNNIFKVFREKDGYKALHFTKKEGYPSKINWGMTKDKEGNIWIGSFGKGLFRYSGDMITYINKEHGLVDNVISDVQFDLDERVWITTTEGVNNFRSPQPFYNKNTTINTFTDYENIPIYAYEQLKLNNPEIIERYLKYAKPQHQFISNGNIAINHSTGEVVIPTNTKYTAIFKNQKPYLLPVGSGQSAAFDKQNNLWLGSDGAGIYKLDGKKVQTFSYTNERNYNRVFSIFIDSKDRVWGGAYSGGIDCIIEDSLCRFDFNGKFQTTSTFILGETPDNRIWFSTERGILYAGILNEKLQFELVDSLSSKNGLSSDIVLDVKYSTDEFLWIATSKGLDKLDYSEYITTGQVKLTSYDINDGLPSSYISGITIDSKENLWLSTTNGLAYFNRENKISHTEPPLAHITNVELFLGQENIFDFSEQTKKITLLPKNLHLPYTMNHLTFSFIGIHLSNPQDVIYRYRLKGFDANWQPITKENKITYSNLPSGKYTFEVSVSCENLEWSETVTYHFIIATPFWKKTWFIVLIVLSIIGLIVLYIRIKTIKLKKNNEILEGKVKSRTSELNEAYLELSEKNQEIVDSIAYAKRIQNAILPPPRIVKEYLENSFVLYKPKDVVAGDFYWMQRIDKNILFAVADCTGHGVPGAMVSVVCNNALNRAVREYSLTNPGEILDKTREIVIEEFEKSDEDVKDGMDIALCSLKLEVEGSKLDKLTSTTPENSATLNFKPQTVALLQYAGAHNPLWVIRNGEIIETKANKQPIGQFDKAAPYTTHFIELKKGDTLYIFSDGYVDQFGGDKGKKFKSKAFRTLLLSINDKPMEEQKSIINSSFENWRGDLEQIDDVCIIGVRI